MDMSLDLLNKSDAHIRKMIHVFMRVDNDHYLLHPELLCTPLYRCIHKSHQFCALWFSLQHFVSQKCYPSLSSNWYIWRICGLFWLLRWFYDSHSNTYLTDQGDDRHGWRESRYECKTVSQTASCCRSWSSIMFSMKIIFKIIFSMKIMFSKKRGNFLFWCSCIGLQTLTVANHSWQSIEIDSIQSGITAYLESGIKSTYTVVEFYVLQHFYIQTWNFTKDRGTLQKIVELYKIPWNFTSPKYHLILAPQ